MNVDCLSIFLAYKLKIYTSDLFFARHFFAKYLFLWLIFFARHFFSHLVDEIKLLHKFWAGMIGTIEMRIVSYLLNENLQGFTY